MTSGRVSFIGAGPGAADLITLRGAKRIAEADIVVWAASLVDPECVRSHARRDAELIDSSRITHDEVLDIYRRAAGQRQNVARVHSGDPALWGAVQEQYDSCQRLGLDVEIVPGVSAFSAAAAVAGRELTVPEVAQSLILTRLEGGKTPMPAGEQVREFARHGTTMAIFLSAARSGQLVDELRAGGYPDDTPVIVAYKVTWPDELILHSTIGELADTVKQHRLWRHTLFLVGKALQAGGTRSHLYHAGHFHTYRKADPEARRALRAAGTTSEPVDAEPARAGGWPLLASRSGWVAARVTGKWNAPSAPTAPSTSTLSDSPISSTSRGNSAGGQSAQPASVAAWSAVRGWQETARLAPRYGSRPRPAEATRPVRPVAVDQEALALDETSAKPAAPTPTAATRAAPTPTPAAPAVLTPASPTPAVPVPSVPVSSAAEPLAPQASEPASPLPAPIPPTPAAAPVRSIPAPEPALPATPAKQPAKSVAAARATAARKSAGKRGKKPGGQGKPTE